MKRQMVTLLIGLALIAVVVAAAFAASPHFVNASASGPNASGNLIVSFKEAGLGDNQLIHYTASADATAVYAIGNNGGNFPPSPTKQQVNGPVSASGTFNSGKNGAVNGSLTLTPPPSTLKVPPGQTLYLVSVSYTNVAITDTTNGVTQGIPGTFSRTFFTLP